MAYENLHSTSDDSKQTEQELDEQSRYEHLQAEISAMFISLSLGQLDTLIEAALKKLLDFFRMDRCGLIRISRREQAYQIMHVAYGDNIPHVETYTNLPISIFPWIYRSVIEQQKILSFESLEDMPPEAAIDQQTYRTSDVRSFLHIPVAIGGNYDYMITINSLTEERSWPPNLGHRMRFIGELFSLAVERQQAQIELERELGFKRFLSLLAARFIHIRDEEMDAEIECGLRGFVECLGFDRAVVAQFSPDTTTALLVHYWVQTGQPPPRDLIPLAAIPWISDKILRGEVAIINELNNLPETPDKDRALLTDVGAESGIVLPLKCQGQITGFLSFLDLRQKRLFTEEEVMNLQLAADVLANALARQRADSTVKQHILEIESLKKRLEQENLYLREEVALQVSHKALVCESTAMKKVLAQAEQVAPTDTTVLIQGETGTGKEVMARTIHALSARKDRPLVTVNCASLSPSLIESDLFGREKGAYTGAMTRMAGRFEIADKSTLFLDEIGELPFDIQSKLLRVLEEGSFERLGSTRTIQVNVRIIAATNRDLAKDVEAGKFRKDLYYRLNVFPIFIPPLRERPEDISPLVWTFVKHHRAGLSKSIERIPRKSMERLKRYPWPGNARELRNIIEHAIIISRGKTLEPVLPPIDQSHSQEINANLQDIERLHIVSVLEKCGWRITGAGGAAAALGLKRTTLQSKMKKLGIIRPSG